MAFSDPTPRSPDAQTPSPGTGAGTGPGWHCWLLLGLFVVCAGGIYSVHLVKMPYPEWPAQALSYHNFADGRPLCAGECHGKGKGESQGFGGG